MAQHILNVRVKRKYFALYQEILEGLTKGTVIVNWQDNDLLHNWYEKEKPNYQIYLWLTSKEVLFCVIAFDKTANAANY